MRATLEVPALIAAFFLAIWPCPAPAQTALPPEQQEAAFTSGELVSAGQQFFGTVSRGLASLIERAVGQWGLPNGYVLGEEGGGAFFGGLRYVEGMLYTKNAGDLKVFWQGPTVGWDFSGDGARTMMLVYSLPATQAIYQRFGYATSWIQTTATGGLALSLVIILLCREMVDAKAFSEWGWRVPFIASAILLVFSVYVRLRLHESPIFQKMKEEGKASKAPLTESFLRYPNNKYVLLALLGACAGTSAVWYTGQFYALFFLTITLKLDYLSAYLLILTSLIIGTPFFIVFGWLSDRIGRLKLILLGCLIAALTYFPLFSALTHYANPDLEAFSDRNSVTVIADGSTCELHVFVTPFTQFSNCDRAQDLVTKLGVSFKTESVANSGDKVSLKIGPTTVQGCDAAKWNAAFLDAGYPNLQRDNNGAVTPKAANSAKINWAMTELILVIMVIYITMAYGPIAAFLVELFPTRIRYTSISLPYHIGAGWFGGMLPLLATAIVASTGNIYNGLWYPIAVAVMTTVVGGLFLRDTKGIDIMVGSGVEAAQHA